MAMKRVYVDNKSIFLYQNKASIVYKMLVFYKYDYNPETTLHVYGKKETTRVNFYDDWGNSYIVAAMDQLGHYTWQGRPVFQGRVTSPRTYVALDATTKTCM